MISRGWGVFVESQLLFPVRSLELFSRDNAELVRASECQPNVKILRMVLERLVPSCDNVPAL